MCRTSARQFRMQWSSARSPRPVDFRRAIHRQRRRVLDLDPVCIGRHDRRDLAASRPSLPVPSCKRRGIGRGRSRPARRVQQISLLADAPTDDPSWFSACSTAIGGGLRRRARERRRRRAAPLHHVCVSRALRNQRCHRHRAPPPRHRSKAILVADDVRQQDLGIRQQSVPCVHAAATTPAQRLNVSLRSFHPDVSVFPDRVVGSTCALSFSRIARRSLALQPAHSRCHQSCDTLIEGFSHFVTSMTAPIASGWSGCRVGLAPTGKAPPLHGAHPTRTLASLSYCSGEVDFSPYQRTRLSRYIAVCYV